MRLDLAAGNDRFQAAIGTGASRKVVAEIDGPLVGPEIPSEKECQKLLGDTSRSAWVIDEDKNDGDPIRTKFSGYRAVWVGKILHEGEKLRGALKTGKATEEEVREAWHGFYLGASAPGSGTRAVVLNFSELVEYCGGDEEVAEGVAMSLAEKGAKIIR